MPVDYCPQIARRIVVRGVRFLMKAKTTKLEAERRSEGAGAAVAHASAHWHGYVKEWICGGRLLDSRMMTEGIAPLLAQNARNVTRRKGDGGLLGRSATPDDQESFVDG